MAEIIIALIALSIGAGIGFVGAKPWLARKVQKSKRGNHRFVVNGRTYETQDVTIRRTVSAYTGESSKLVSVGGIQDRQTP